MNDSGFSSLLSVLLSGVVSGIVVAGLNYLLTRNKTNAETKKLQLEAEKIVLESEKLRKELSTNVESIVSASYELANTAERVIYDSRNSDIGFDFEGRGNQIWINENGKDKPITEKGEGELTCDSKEILNLRRTNTDGRYEVLLKSYKFDNSEKPYIPRDDLMEGSRKLRVNFEAKVRGGGQTLKFIFKGEESGKFLATKEIKISEEIWKPIKMHFLVSSAENSFLRIDVQEISKLPSSLQIRNFVLTEKIS